MTPRALRSWLAASHKRYPVAVVLGGSWSGLSFVRSLGRRGVPTLLLENDRFLGTYTRYARTVLLPPPDESPEAWIDLLEAVAEASGRPGVLFATGDAHTLLLSRNRDALSAHFRFLVPSAETVERILDKRQQYAVAETAGVPVPPVHFPRSVEELQALSAKIAYPVLLKPYVSHVARAAVGGKVIVAYSAPRLVADYAKCVALGVPMMVQEIVAGDDSALVGYLALFDREGRELAWLTKQKLRQNPPGFGDGSLQVTVDVPEVAELSRRLVAAFDYCGFASVEFKRDERDGTLYLIEMNPRTVSGNQLAISAGVDFPWIGYRYLTDSAGAAFPRPAFRPHVRYLNEELDPFAYIALRRSGALRLGQWLGSLRGVEARAIGAWDDPLPMLVGLWRVIRLLLARTYARRGA